EGGMTTRWSIRPSRQHSSSNPIAAATTASLIQPTRVMRKPSPRMAVVPAKRAPLHGASAEPGPSIPETGVFARLLSAPAVHPSTLGDYWIPALRSAGEEPASLGRNDSRGSFLQIGRQERAVDDPGQIHVLLQHADSFH